MDDQGWVSIAKIADFNRVKRMTTSIPFILDALQSSSMVEVQGDRVRRRDDWSKWVMTSGLHTLSLKSKTQEEQVDEKDNVIKNSELSEQNAHDRSMHEEVPSNKDGANIVRDSNSGHNRKDCPTDADACHGESRDSIKITDTESSLENQISQLNTSLSCMETKGSSNGSKVENTGGKDCMRWGSTEGTIKSANRVDHERKNLVSLQKRGGLSKITTITMVSTTLEGAFCSSCN